MSCECFGYNVSFITFTMWQSMFNGVFECNITYGVNNINVIKMIHRTHFVLFSLIWFVLGKCLALFRIQYEIDQQWILKDVF